MSTADVATILGISVPGVVKAAAVAGVGQKVGRDYVFTVADVEKLKRRPHVGRPRK